MEYPSSKVFNSIVGYPWGAVNSTNGEPTRY